MVRQDHAIVTDRAILHEFETVWKTRWQKFEHLSPSQWNQIVGFLQRVMFPVSWAFSDWTPQLVQKLVRAKKRRSAVGSDGVSRDDVIKLPMQGYQAISEMYKTVENTHRWPQQCLIIGQGQRVGVG